MAVGFLPEQVASRIVAIHEQLVSPHIAVSRRQDLVREQRALWDEAFPGMPFEEIARKTGPFLLAA